MNKIKQWWLEHKLNGLRKDYDRLSGTIDSMVMERSDIMVRMDSLAKELNQL